MANQEFADGTLRFTLPIPTSKGSAVVARAQFEMKSRSVAEEFQKSERKYRCAVKYCDDLVIVATLTGKTVDRADGRGNVHRMPVFAIVELGDRYGIYKP